MLYLPGRFGRDSKCMFSKILMIIMWNCADIRDPTHTQESKVYKEKSEISKLHTGMYQENNTGKNVHTLFELQAF